MTLPQVIAVLLLALALALVARPGAASNATGPRGEGAATISGIAATNIQYRLAPDDPARLSGVGLTVHAAAGAAPTRLQVQLSPSSPWYACRRVAGADWFCATPGATVRAATELRVVSAS